MTRKPCKSFSLIFYFRAEHTYKSKNIADAN